MSASSHETLEGRWRESFGNTQGLSSNSSKPTCDPMRNITSTDVSCAARLPSAFRTNACTLEPRRSNCNSHQHNVSILHSTNFQRYPTHTSPRHASPIASALRALNIG